MVAFASVIYWDAIDYLDDFIESINNQSYDGFDVLLINDDIKNLDLINIKERIKGHQVYIVDKTKSFHTPIELRICLLSEAKKMGYDLIVLGDCDDKFDKNRIQQLVKCYRKHPNYAFFYNDLRLFNGSLAFENMPRITQTIDDILEYNYLGLSNSALNLRMFSEEWINSLIECESFVFDWYLFSRIVLLNKKGCYVENAATIYRIHQNNFVGINSKSHKMLEKELIVKKAHYQILSKYSKKIEMLFNIIKDMTIEDVKSFDNISTFWWGNIKILKEDIADV